VTSLTKLIDVQATIVLFSCSFVEQPIPKNDHKFCDQRSARICFFRKFINHVINLPDALLFQGIRQGIKFQHIPHGTRAISTTPN
jgi:hypothetical protein